MRAGSFAAAFTPWLEKQSTQISQTFSQISQQLGKTSSSGSRNNDFIYGKVRGDYNYNFTFRLEGDGFVQTGVLVANATNKDGGQPIPLRCIWKRKIGDHAVIIPGIESNMYHISADDIGMTVCVEATPLDGGGAFQGTARGMIGPFELDRSTRQSLEDAICGSGARGAQAAEPRGSRFPVRHFRSEEDRPEDLVIHVTQDEVKVVHPGLGQQNGKEVTAAYVADYPKVIFHPLDTCKFQLFLSEEKVFQFAALTRTSRDLIALTIRCFHARKYIATTFIMSKLFQNPATPGAPPIVAPDFNFDLDRVSERLQSELNRMTLQREIVDKVTRNAIHEKQQLQVQLLETISSYTEVIEGLHSQLACLGGADGIEAQLQLQLREARSRYSKVQLEVQEAKSHLATEDESGLGSFADGPGEARSLLPAGEAGKLQEENMQLRSRITELSDASAREDRRDQAHAQELRRLRQDVEALHQEKQSLEHSVNQAESEKKELINNFLYVKGQMDKAQMASASSASAAQACPESQKAISQLRQETATIVEERNRLMQRMEMLSRDLEGNKGRNEAALERVMQANAKLLEERDRLEREHKKASQLYAATMAQLQQGGSGTQQGLTGTSNPAAAQETASGLRTQLAQICALLKQKEDENQSLRMRIRKLATA